MKMKEHGMALIQDNWKNQIYIKMLEETVETLENRLTGGLELQEPVATVYERADGFGVHIHGSVYSGQPLYAARMTATPTKEPTP
jgi:hypothetical protein